MGTVSPLGVPTHFWFTAKHATQDSFVICHSSTGADDSVDSIGVTHAVLGLDSGLSESDAMKVAKALNEAWHSGLVEAGNFTMRLLASSDTCLW